MLLNHFGSKQNQDLLYSIIQEQVTSHDGTELIDYEQALQIRPRLQGVITGISKRVDPTTYSDGPNGNITKQVAQLNRKVIDLCVPGFQKLVAKAQRDPSIRVNRLTQRPVDSTQLTDSQQTPSESVTQRYERLSESRKTLEPARPPIPDFTDPDHSDQSRANPNILYDQMEQSRRKELKDYERTRPGHTADQINTTGIKNKTSDNVPFTVENNGNTQNNPHVDGMIEFTSAQESKKARDQEFQQRLQTLQEKRDTKFKNQANSTPISQLPTQTDGMVPDSTDIIQQRNVVETLTRPNPNDIDIKKFLGGHTSDNIQPHDAPSSNTYPIIEAPPPVTHSMGIDNGMYTHDSIGSHTPNQIRHETNHVIIINAEDRPWVGSWIQDSHGNDTMAPGLSPNRYNFPVKFSPASGTDGMASIKTNFKNVASLEIIDVMLSTHDNPTFIGGMSEETLDIITSVVKSPDPPHSNGIYTGTGDDVDLEMVTDSEAELETNSIGPATKLIPETSTNLPELLPYIQLSIYKYPYLLFNIQEFSGKFHSTSYNNQNMVSRLVIAKHYLQRPGRGSAGDNLLDGYFLLKPMLGHHLNSLTFYPTPLPKLDTFTLSLSTPDGGSYGNNNPWNLDGLQISGITLHQTGLSSTIDLVLDTAFHPCLYLRGDTLLIREFKILHHQQALVKIKTSLTDLEHQVSRYLTSENSTFTVVSTSYRCGVSGRKIHPTFHNVISLSLPVNIDSFGSVTTDSLLHSGTIPGRTDWLAGGFILNRSIQPTYTIKVSCLSSELEREALRL